MHNERRVGDHVAPSKLVAGCSVANPPPRRRSLLLFSPVRSGHEAPEQQRKEIKVRPDRTASQLVERALYLLYYRLR